MHGIGCNIFIMVSDMLKPSGLEPSIWRDAYRLCAEVKKKKQGLLVRKGEDEDKRVSNSER